MNLDKIFRVRSLGIFQVEALLEGFLDSRGCAVLIVVSARAHRSTLYELGKYLEVECGESGETVGKDSPVLREVA